MNVRRAHMIKPNEGTEYPRNLLFFDTETTEQHDETIEDFETELVLKLGVAYHQRDGKPSKYFHFTREEQFWNFVESKVQPKQKIYLIAHNVAFDFRVVKGFEILKERGYKLNKFIYNGTTNLWDFRRGDISIAVLDNMNFFKSSLKTLGHSIGVEKMEMPTNNIRRLADYCENDVRIMVEAWRLLFIFLKENNLGNFSRTIASQAFSAYRHRFMKTPIYIHTNDRAIALERESYHGGRTEAFFIGTSPRKMNFLLDVNSMYPSVMRSFDYPSMLIRSTKKISLETYRRRYKGKYCLTARCVVHTYEPVFPYKRDDDKLIFPIGQFETVLTTREIDYALKNGILISIQEAVIYKKSNLFREYVDFFYAKRAEYKKSENEAFSYICKLFLNSLYGKFGQKHSIYEKLDVERAHAIHKAFDAHYGEGCDGAENIDGVPFRRIDGVIEYEITPEGNAGESFNSFCAIASHITADARMKLWEYFNIAGRNNVFYCDTDSMIVNLRGYQNCKKVIGKDIGMLSLQETASRLIIYGAKDYMFGDKEVMKGIKKNARRISSDTFEQVSFEGIRGAMRKGRMNKMIISNTTKKLSRLYDKGEIGTGGKVEPFEVYEQRLF